MGTNFSLTKLLLYAAVHGILVGVIVGGIIGLFIWREALKELEILTLPSIKNSPHFVKNDTCEVCPELTCDTSICRDSTNPNCISRISDMFMKSELDVKNYSNPRLVPINGFLTPEESSWIIKWSKVADYSPGTILTFPRDQKAWVKLNITHGQICTLTGTFQ